MTDEKPRWKQNKDAYDLKYKREHAHKICISLYDEHLLEIWRSIPEKAKWIREKLLDYEKENS